eukprot:scaffold5435_cov47-Phaeocystis_antarctica.AAC.1
MVVGARVVVWVGVRVWVWVRVWVRVRVGSEQRAHHVRGARLRAGNILATDEAQPEAAVRVRVLGLGLRVLATDERTDFAQP